MNTVSKMLLILLLLLIHINNSYACESCQRNFEYELKQGTSNSAHAEEMLKLINKPNILSASSSKNIQTASVSKNYPIFNTNKKLVGKSTKDTLPPTSYVEPGTKPDKKVTIEMTEGETFIGNGVVYKGFFINGKVPGPTIKVVEGDVIEFTVVNNGKVPHGVSIHAAYTQTSKHLGKIEPGKTKSMLFRASVPGVYMYHCAPGGHAIPMHVLMGQYGMMVVEPKTQKFKMEEVLGKKPDVELYLVNHELYDSGKNAIEGKPKYTMFNGKLFRYVEEPVNAKPGDFIRIYFLNIGPNLISTFHIVGIVWDYAYWQGMPNPENTFVGGQSVLAGPSDSWIVDFRAPEDEGAYLMLNHAVGQTSRGAIGILNVSKDAERSIETLADGPSYTKEELKKHVDSAIRVISPYEPSKEELDNPWKLPAGETRAKVQIIGNSYYPKVIEIPVGTTVEWTNEDVFTYFSGEFSGIHNVMAFAGPETFASPLLGHAEKFSHTFTKAGEYNYLCTPHPYMRGVIKVVDKK